ncbi:MAG: SMP-30/gluconolactonase/LRE family protein [Deltaproteobacteria bacterium]|nr:MAG: SMP-30/gluconolactonase/LRE family protein [Deltaproteobacteria bacterium]
MGRCQKAIAPAMAKATASPRTASGWARESARMRRIKAPGTARGVPAPGPGFLGQLPSGRVANGLTLAGSAPHARGRPRRVKGLTSPPRACEARPTMKRTVLTTGLQFPEGPVWLGPRRVAFTEIRGQCVSLWHDGALTRVARTGGGANGATLGPDGALYVANNGGLSLGHEGRWTAPDAIPGRIQRVTLAGELSDVAAELPGAPPNRPNDLCFGPDGLLYYTDPHNWEDIEHLGVGRVGRTTLDGRVELVAEIPAFPNGIAFGPDDRLYVAQSVTQKILVMDAKPGATPAVWATLPRGFPDGFCFDAAGRLYAAGSLGDVVVIFEPDGEVRDIVEMGAGSEPTNCCLGDGALYVTLAGTGQLVALDMPVEPLPLYPARR